MKDFIETNFLNLATKELSPILMKDIANQFHKKRKGDVDEIYVTQDSHFVPLIPFIDFFPNLDNHQTIYPTI